MGRPPRSPLTLGVIVLLRLRRLAAGKRETYTQAHETDAQGHQSQQSKLFPGYLQLLRWVCAARDRYRLYSKLRRFAGAGGIAICDRYLVPQISLMDGPNIARSVEASRMNRLVRLMLRAETSYYSRIMPADLLVVLRVEPEIAVRRKTDEDESHVRTRSRELWEIDWSDTRARVVDAGQPVGEVVARLRSLVWSEL
jgi:thymidylate kinase